MSKSRYVKLNGTFRDDFLAQEALYQGAVLSHLLFITVLEGLSTEIWSGHSELPYA